MEMGDLRADWPVLSDVAKMRYLRYLCLTQSTNVKLYLLISCPQLTTIDEITTQTVAFAILTIEKTILETCDS